MIDNFEIGRRIKLLRNQLGCSMVEMASVAKMGTNAYRNWENDGVLPKVKHFIVLADTLNISVDYLLFRSDIPEMNGDERVCEALSNEDGELVMLFEQLLVERARRDREASCQEEQ